jgi:hypothetical protein
MMCINYFEKRRNKLIYTPKDVYDFAVIGAVHRMRLALDCGNNSTEWYYSKECMTALIAASALGHFDCAQLLLERGAAIDSKDDHGCTALMLATMRGHIECMRLLLDGGADIENKGTEGFSSLMITSVVTNTCITRLLLDRGATIDEVFFTNVTFKNQECKQMILDEIQHRVRRATFDSFINHHIEYPPLIHDIYSRCYPSGDLRVAAPVIGWDRAEAVRNKHYFNEILFYVHLYVANVLSKRSTKQTTQSSSRRCSNSRGMLASNSNTTSTLMMVLADRLMMYLKPA